MAYIGNFPYSAARSFSGVLIKACAAGPPGQSDRVPYAG